MRPSSDETAGDGRGEHPLRALVAGPYLGGQGEKDAMYPIRSTDAGGQQLTGAKNYIIRFKQETPVNAFWSVTVYNAEDKMLVENPIQRTKLRSDTPGLMKRGDGDQLLKAAVRTGKEIHYENDHRYPWGIPRHCQRGLHLWFPSG